MKVWEALLEVLEALQKVWEAHTESLGGVRRSTQRSGRNREAFPEVRQGSRGPYGGLTGSGGPCS